MKNLFHCRKIQFQTVSYEPFRAILRQNEWKGFRTLRFTGVVMLLGLTVAGAQRAEGAGFPPLARAEAAVIRLAQGDFAEAAKQARAGLQDTPDSATLNTLAGAILLNTGDARSAQTAFERAIKAVPADPLANFGRGLAQLAQGDRKAAQQSFTKAEQSGGDKTHLLLARRYAQWLDGTQIALGGAGLPDTFVPAQRALEGMTAFRKGDTRKAITELEATYAAMPGNLVTQPGGLLMRFEAIHPILSAAPRLPANHGLVSPLSAERALSGAIQLEPDNAGTSATFVSFECDGQTLGLVNQRPFVYVWDSRKTPNGWHTLTVTLFDRNGDEMGKTTRRVRTFNAGGGEADGDTERAAQLRASLWQALTLRPDRCACAYTLGMAYRAVGDLPQARRWFLRTAAIQPDYKEVRAQLASTGGLNYATEAIWGGLPTEKVVALTFDDGPKPGMTEPLVDILVKEGVPATFFVIGRHISDYPQLAQQIVAAGMELANHSYTHSNLTRLSETAVARELVQTQAAIQAATGKIPRFVRPPGGNWNGKVAQVARQWGLTPCMWTVDVYGSEVVGAQQVADAVLAQVRPGSIILMHNGKMSTLQALPTIIRELKKRGYAFATVDTLARRLSAAKAAERAAALRNANPNARRIE
jgi:peptidoglycan-N-acetylglucosamine deacetylase